MTDLIKIVLEKGDHWSLGILLFCVLLLALFKTPLLGNIPQTHIFKITNNILWSVTGLVAFYIAIVLLRDISKDQKEVELAKIDQALKLIEKNAELMKSDPALSKRANTTFEHIQANTTFQPDQHPISDPGIDHSKCWIKPMQEGISLVHQPSFMGDDVIENSIPIKVYYVLDQRRVSAHKILFFKIQLDNGLVGWVRDAQLDKNPKCYE